MKDFAEKFYKGKAWQRVRAQFVNDRISEDGGMCQRCKAAPGFIVHHTIELTPENIGDAGIALNPELFEFLCLDCHNKEHGHFDNRGRVSFDANGDVIDLGGVS